MDEKLKQENAELKRLLRQAMSDAEYLLSSIKSDCDYCSSTSCLSNKRCEPKWRYAAEAEKLLNGGEPNG